MKTNIRLPVLQQKEVEMADFIDKTEKSFEKSMEIITEKILLQLSRQKLKLKGFQ